MRAPLVERARRGDDVAFGELVDADGDRCFAIAYRILRDHEAAQDAVQQAFLLAWRDLPKLRDVERYDVWLHRLLVNACYEESRRQRRWTGRIRMLPIDGPGSRLTRRSRSTTATSSTGPSPDSRHNTAPCSCSITTPGCRSPRSPRSSACRLARSSPVSITRPARCERGSRSIPPLTLRRSSRHERAPRSRRRPGHVAGRRPGGPSRHRRAARSRLPSGRPPSRELVSACPRGGPRCPASSCSPAPPRSSRSPSVAFAIGVPGAGQAPSRPARNDVPAGDALAVARSSALPTGPAFSSTRYGYDIAYHQELDCRAIDPGLVLRCRQRQLERPGGGSLLRRGTCSSPDSQRTSARDVRRRVDRVLPDRLARRAGFACAVHGHAHHARDHAGRRTSRRLLAGGRRG